MTPIHFGAAERRLFGIFDPARRGVTSGRAVLLCHPAGDEHVFAYRTLRQLAVRISHEGRHVLRFDYYGTGDSFGASGEGNVDGWCDDIETAVAELKDMTGLSKVSLVGLRLGANLAARVAAKRPDDIDNLVLWEPLPVDENADISSLDHGDVPSIDPSLLSPAARSRTLVVLTAQNSRSGEFENLSVERVEIGTPWIEERKVGGAVPLNALHCIVNWLK